MISREIGDRYGEGFALSNIGSTIAQQQQYRQSLLPLQRAYPIFREINLPSESGLVQSQLRATLNGIRDNNLPAEYQQKCRTTAQATGIPIAELCPE